MIFLLLRVLLCTKCAEIPIEVTYTGCTDESCESICRLGQAICNDINHPICEFGYFQFTTSSGWDCVQCPYANTNDNYSYKCMDCIENPITWENNRLCTYDYAILNGEPTTGAYVKILISQPELFFISKAQSPQISLLYRDTLLNYETFICNGCQQFCFDYYDDYCYFFENQLDYKFSGIICQEKYYFQDDQCLPCTMQNCLDCDDEYCYECMEGFTFDYDYINCIPCFNRCTDCYVDLDEDDEIVQYCINCDSNTQDFRIQSLDFKQCVECGYSCSRCEYMSIKSDIEITYPFRELIYIPSDEYQNYFKKCRQCLKSDQILSNDGESCDICFIDNCLICYFQWESGNTLLLNFRPNYDELADQKCYQCKPGYNLNENQQTCIETVNTDFCVNKDNEGKCQRCQTISGGKTEYLLQISNDNAICNSKIECEYQISNCQSCISFIKDSKTIYQCIRCNQGFYPDFISGQCVECQSYCKQCWQYTQSYNLTQYLLLQIPARYPEQYAIDLQQIEQEYILDPICTQCQEGFNLYENECKGCSENCNKILNEDEEVQYIESACEFKEQFGYCSQCFNPFTQRSLISDNSECIECPKYCQACRERTIEEKNKINPFFNPQSISLLRYSNLCYKLQNQQNTQLIYLDSTLGVPVSCVTTKDPEPMTDPKLRARKCRKSITYQMIIDCQNQLENPDYRLSDFFEQKGKTATIKFTQFDSQANYLKWNQETIIDLTLIINFYSGGSGDGPFICDFQKPTQIITQVLQNVFTLQNLKIQLIGFGGDDGTQRVLFQITDSLKFENYAQVAFLDIDMVNKKDSKLSIISLNQQTDFYIKNSNLYLNPEYPPTEFYIQIKNCKSIYLENIIMNLNNGITKQPIIQLSQSQLFKESQTTFLNITLTKCNLIDTYFFIINQMATLNTVYLRQLKIYQSSFTNSAVFTDLDTDKSTDFNAQFIEVIQSNFNDSTFLQTYTAQKLKLYQIELIASTFQQYSVFLDLPLILIDRLFVYSCILSENSSIIQSAEKLLVEGSDQLQEFSITSAHFQQIECSSINCLIIITTPNNYDDIYPNILLENIQLKQISISQMDEQYQNSVNSALILIYEVGNIKLKNIFIIDTISITILYFSQIKEFELEKLLYDWEENNIIEKPQQVPLDDGEIYFVDEGDQIDEAVDGDEGGPGTDEGDEVGGGTDEGAEVGGGTDEGGAGTGTDEGDEGGNDEGDEGGNDERDEVGNDEGDEGGIGTDESGAGTDEGNLRRFRMLSEVEYIQNPKNNLIPVNLECAGRKQESNSFTYYLLYISSFKQKVVIEDVTIQRQLFMNSGSIYIGSYDILEQIENEIIKIQGITMIFNNMVSTKSGADMALIQINSNQNQSISIESSKFSSNHLHQLVSAQLADTPTCLLIKSPYSSLIMNDVQFYYNRATQSGNGINYIKISELTIKNCQFRFTNAMDVIWLKRIEESQLNGKDQLNNLKSYFEILSLGSNLNVVTQSLLIQQTEVFESYGLNGGAFYITMFSNACQTQCSQSLKLENVKFTNIISSLEPKYQTKGGCLFLNSQIDQLNINFSTIQMSNCTARANGGCIYMAPSINSYKMNVENSLFAKCQSLLRSVFNLQYLGVYNTPQLILTNVIIRENNFAEFLENLPDLSVQEKQQLISNNFDDSLFAQTRGSIIIRNSLIENVKYICLIHATNLIELVIYNSIFMNNILFYAPLFYFSFIDTNSTASIVNSGFLNNTSDIKSIDSNLSCEIDFKQQFTFIYSEQTCETIQNNQQYIQDVDNYNYVPLNSDIYVKQYQEMTYSEKFTFDQTYSIIYDEQENLIQFIYPSQRWDFIICLLQEQLLSINSQLESTLQTSIINIPQLNQWNQFKMAKIIFQNNNCLKCYGGLLQIKLISFTKILESFIVIDELQCQNNIAGYYGCITLTSDYELADIIPQQNLIDLPVQKSRILQQENQQIYACQVKNSLFYGNSAKVGPSITIFNVSTSLVNNFIIKNQASLIGGAIYIKGSTIIISNQTFEDNKAQVGGAIYLDGASLGSSSQQNIEFRNNEAEIGKNTLEYTFGLTIQLKQGQFFDKKTYQGSINVTEEYVTQYDIIKENITLPYSMPSNYPSLTNLLILPSGQSVSKYKYFYEYTQEYIHFEYLFRIINLNSLGEPIIQENNEIQDFCLIRGRVQNLTYYDDLINFSDNYTYPQKGFYNSTKGGFDFDNVIIYFDPYSPPELYLELKIICSSVKIPIYNQEPPYQIIQYNTNYELFARIRTYQCQKGEVYQSGKCIPCKPENNQYSVILNAQFCSSFNSDFMEDIKQSSIKLRKGFWRPYFNNDQTEYCTNLASNCLGGWIPGDPSCYEGHIGGLCESCDLYAISNDEKYTQTSPFVCGGCKPTEQYNMIVLIATTLVSFISMVFAVKGTYEQSQLLLARDTCHMMGILVRSTISDLATLMKMLTNYFQIIQFIGTFQLNIPPSLISAAQTVGNPTKSTATSLDCLFTTLSETNVLYFRMIWGLLQPAMYLIGFYLIYLLLVLFRILPFKINVITTALIYQFLLLQPTFVDGFIVLASSRIISGIPYIQRDVAYRYDSETHQMWMLQFILPMLFVWAIALPLLLRFLLWRKRKLLQDKSVKLIYGFFYSEYTEKSYSWEFMKIFSKEVMVIIIAYYSQKVIVKGLLCVVVLYIYGTYLVQIGPYRNRRLNKLDLYSTLSLSMSLCLGVLMKGTQDYEFWYLFYLISIILVLINVPFLMMIVYYLLENYFMEFSPLIDKIRDKVDSKYPNLKYKNNFVRKLLLNQEKMHLRGKYLWKVLRDSVEETRQLSKENQLQFGQVFPPYIQIDSEQASLQEMIQQRTIKLIRDSEILDFNNYSFGTPVGVERQKKQSLLEIDIKSNIVNRNSQCKNIVISNDQEELDNLEGQFENQNKVRLSNQDITKIALDENMIIVQQKEAQEYNSFRGHIQEGKKQGHGTISWEKKEGDMIREQYQGHFLDDLFDGFGVYQYSNGTKYEGEWKKGLKEGYGELVDKDKSYVGQFQQDLFHGQGLLKIQNISINGEWKKGKLQGIAVIQNEQYEMKSYWENGIFKDWIN